MFKVELQADAVVKGEVCKGGTIKVSEEFVGRDVYIVVLSWESK